MWSLHIPRPSDTYVMQYIFWLPYFQANSKFLDQCVTWYLHFGANDGSRPSIVATNEI